MRKPSLTNLIFWILPLLLASSKAGARPLRHTWLSVTTYYSQYSDIRASTASAAENLEPSYDVDVALRLRGPFSAGFFIGRSTDNLYKTQGGGLRVRLPGFFFLGGNLSRDMKLEAKKYPVNTHFFGYLVQQEHSHPTTNVKTRYTGSNMGVGMDIFLFNPYAYLSGQVSIFNTQGNAFVMYSYGLGFQF